MGSKRESMKRCQKVHHVVNSYVPRDWFETNLCYQKIEEKVRMCRGLLGR